MPIVTTILGGIATLLTGSDDGPSGANAVRTAVNEIESLREREFTATLGEPDIAPNGGRYFTDPKVTIPLRDVPFDGANQLVFDLPEGHDDEFSTFNGLLELFDLDLDTMEDLDGETVPVMFVGGNASVVWDEIDTSEPDTEENSEEDIEYQSSDGLDVGAEEDDSDESGVTVEETTISSDDDD